LKKFTSLVFVIFIMISGCSKFEQALPGKSSGTKLDDSHVVAKVGDDVVYDQQIEQFLGQLPPQVRSRYGAREIRKEIADGFVSMKMLAWEARRRGIDKREDIQLKIAMLTDQALAREIEEELKKNIKVDESEIQKYYNEHKDRYAPMPRVHALQIVLASETDAKSVLAKLNKGSDFAQLARQHSKDTATAAKGGDLGWLSKGRMENMDPSLEKVIFELKEGQIGPIVKTTAGYHIVKVEKIIAGRERPYDQVQKSIERIVMREKLNKAVGELKDEIKRKGKVEINEKYFSQFKESERPAAPGMGPGAKPAE
jgi:peptidyl-prolyl cis-trans isomerase C